ncbi:MAG: outer membrane protein assembly factor BamA [Gemmatimonadetes bacterium]|nr:outer membrane protein assembly factor BamA [Gemmatimonadota bacterium]
MNRPAAPGRGAAAALASLAVLLLLAGAGPALAQDEDPTQRLASLSVRVDSIAVIGNDRHVSDVIITRSGLRVGNVVRGAQIQQAVKNLFSSGDFSDVRIGVVDDDDPERGVFYILVEERPYVSSYEFTGLTVVDEGMIRDTIGLARSSPLDPDRIARTRGTLLDMLSDEGFPTAQVDTLVREDPEIPSQFLVVFAVDEGPRMGVAEVVFEGNERFTDDQLLEHLALNEEGFLWTRSGQLRRNEYRRDLVERLPELYRSWGYLDFAVLGDTVIADRQTGKGRVIIHVSEGPEYVLESLRVSGNRNFPLEVVEPIARKGQREPQVGEEYPPFNFTSFYAAPGELADLYRDAGYLRAQAIPEIRRVETGPGERPRLAATMVILENQASYIREISIEGNTYTHDRVIRSRLFVFPGDVYSQQRLVSSFQAIQGLNFFDPLPPDEAINIRERPDGDIDIALRVQEKNTGMMNFGVTASGYTGLAGFIGYTQPNLFGLAKSGSFRWIFGRRQQDLDLTYSDPEIRGSLYSGNISLRDSRDQFTGFSLGDRRQRGGLVEFGIPVLGLRQTRAFIGYSLFADRVSGLDTTDVVGQRFSLFNGTRSAVSVRLVQDGRNNPVFPTAGSRNQLLIRHTGGGLGGDGNYRRLDLTSEWFVPVGEIGGGPGAAAPAEITFGLAFQAGALIGDNPFFTERYYVGGTQAGIQLRGYDEASVTPQGHVPGESQFSDLDRVGEAFFRAGATLGLKLTSSVFFSTFMDAGNVWLDWRQLNPSDLLVGAGVGASLVTPFGPLGLDYAYGFQRRDAVGRPDPGWQLHFKFGRVY